VTISKRAKIPDKLRKVLTNLDSTGGSVGSVDWIDVTGKPATFPPETHSHTTSNITGLDTALAGKQPLATVLTNTTAAFTTAQETKLAGIATGAEVNVNADWNAVSGDAQILNKPTISGSNTGDQTSIVGITGTKAQFDTAVTDGNFMYIGDPPTAHTQTASTISDFDSASRAQTEAELIAGANVTITPAGSGASRTLTIAASGGGGGGGSPILSWII
jgi:hypothetical protein